MNQQINTRVLVIDDEEAVRDGFRTVLTPRDTSSEDAMNDAAAALFGVPKPQLAINRQLKFEVDFAVSGTAGVTKVQRAVASNSPYAVIFCDVRMPGMDGVQAIQLIRAVDPRAEVVFVTAFSDYSLQEITQRTGHDVGYFVKPFVTDEVMQLATKLVLQWSRARELEGLVTALSGLHGETTNLDRLLTHLLGEVCSWLNTSSAALLERRGATIRHRLGVGDLGIDTSTGPLIEQLSNIELANEPINLNAHTIMPIAEFGLVLAVRDLDRLTSERRHMLTVFLQHAALAIRNNEMQQEMTRQQRLATVGEAVGYLVHDLRGPLTSAGAIVKMKRAGVEFPWSEDETLDRIDLALRRASAMLQDTLDVCKGAVTIEYDSFDLATELAEAHKLWDITLKERGVQLTMAHPDQLVVSGDAGKLMRAIWNLTWNATHVVRKQPNAAISITATADAEAVRVTVRDNGPGLAPELAHDLFKPLDPRHRSHNGFGLAIVKQVVDGHNATLEVETGATGTAITLNLPRTS